jgi:hypothetical protein
MLLRPVEGHAAKPGYAITLKEYMAKIVAAALRDVGPLR